MNISRIAVVLSQNVFISNTFVISLVKLKINAENSHQN